MRHVRICKKRKAELKILPLAQNCRFLLSPALFVSTASYSEKATFIVQYVPSTNVPACSHHLSDMFFLIQSLFIVHDTFLHLAQ